MYVRVRACVRACVCVFIDHRVLEENAMFQNTEQWLYCSVTWYPPPNSIVYGMALYILITRGEDSSWAIIPKLLHITCMSTT